MKEPRGMRIKGGGYSGNSLDISHLDDTGKCHVMTSSHGEVTSISLTKTEAKRVIKWLTKWVEFKNTSTVQEVKHGN